MYADTTSRFELCDMVKSNAKQLNKEGFYYRCAPGLQADHIESGRKQRPAGVAAAPVFASRGDAQQSSGPLLQEALRAGASGLNPSDIRAVRTLSFKQSE